MSTDDDLVAELRALAPTVYDSRASRIIEAADRIEVLSNINDLNAASARQYAHTMTRALAAESKLAAVREYLSGDRMQWAHKGGLIEILDGTDADA